MELDFEMDLMNDEKYHSEERYVFRKRLLDEAHDDED